MGSEQRDVPEEGGSPPSARDRLLVAVSRDGHLRARAACTSGVVAEAVTRHVPSHLGSMALARALTSAALFPISEKDSERIGLQWSGEGVLGTVMAEVRPPGDLRALLRVPKARHPEGKYPGRRGVGFALLPNGFLSILRQDPTGAFTQGQVALYNGEIDEDLEYYFVKSEQTPTRVRVMTELHPEEQRVACNGVLIQCLGGSSEELLPDFRLHERLSAEEEPHSLLEKAFDGRAFEIVSEHALAYRCPCSIERIETGIMLLEPAEILDMINEDQGARVLCDFCGTRYEFSREDLEDLLARKVSSRKDS